MEGGISICAIVGCGLPVKAKGFCRNHYKRLVRHGSPLGGGDVRLRNVGFCSVDGCDEPSSKKGLCNAHYLRQRRHGRLELVHPWKATGNHCKGECPGVKKIRAHMDYLANTDVYKARAAIWEKKPENWQKKLDYWAREDVQDQARARTRNWNKSNPEKKKAMDAAFKAANRSLVTSYKAARRARVLQATPAWLTEEHWVAIRSVYAEAEKLTKETGIRHEVDHIVPLQGKTVCGLHVPWNLRAIPATRNNRRPRVWRGED